MTTKPDEYWMRIALDAANRAAECDEVPVGACIVDSAGELLSVASNLTITNSDPTAHAEILAIRLAAGQIGNYRLVGATLYTTIEPCIMCSGAIVNARIARLVFGARDLRYGGVESVFRLCDSPLLNHRVEIASGVLEPACSEIMKAFFLSKRGITGTDQQSERAT